MNIFNGRKTLIGFDPPGLVSRWVRMKFCCQHGNQDARSIVGVHLFSTRNFAQTPVLQGFRSGFPVQFRRSSSRATVHPTQSSRVAFPAKSAEISQLMRGFFSQACPFAGALTWRHVSDRYDSLGEAARGSRLRRPLAKKPTASSKAGRFHLMETCSPRLHGVA